MKLDELVANKIIEKATGYCEWVNHLVTVEKKDAEKSLRLCIDPGELNKSIFDEHAFIPTFEDVSSQLNGMKYFTVLDLKDGYWHVKLDEESKKLCTFATPYGNYRFLRLPFGIKTAPGVFQQLNFENFGDIENVMIYFDDILIVGRTRKEHDEVLKKVLDRAREKNVRFNINKAQIALEEVKYLGHIFSYNQIKPDPERLLAIAEMTRPKNKNDLQTFLGVVNFMTPFIPNLSDRTAPLRELIKKNVLFLWTELHDKVFDEIKKCILNSEILVPFDISKELIIQCDASQGGLGCGLIQDGKPISFASRSLTASERNYSQIEKEMLSIIFACQKFHFYTYGRTVRIVNDHKPLLGIMNKEIHKIASAKLQRMRLKLLNYDIILEHAPGKTIVLADYLSRYMSKSEKVSEDQSITESILSINVTDARKIELQQETNNDEILKQIKEYCKFGWPNNKDKCDPSTRYFYRLRSDILLEDEILFYKQRIIIPKSMRKEILHQLHKPHFGINKTLKRAQNSVFWPNISNEIEQTVSNCIICQENAPKIQKEPLLPHDIPNEPFKKIACDILDFKSKSFLVVVDFYSKWIELVKLKGKTAHHVNTELLRLFATFGYPHIIIADNMPMGSYETKQFAKKHDIEIITSSPNFPQSNGMAEKAVGICKNILRKSENEEDILRALLAYRTTPTKNMSYSPAQLIQNRNLRTELPMHIDKFRPELCIDVEKQQQAKQKIYWYEYRHGDGDGGRGGNVGNKAKDSMA
ncbi:uncharacterized protein K02A2.6-like [Sitodiplosis mosellana]|uniref:uncharacterized protein K02A2.6-like n=1 Tax=Sitodiplosis mosellana TaxID=263140 RepID=UPI002445059B|nr:uncharacterized protein K02A2.6-like [Sitodiplosis mosellana]